MPDQPGAVGTTDPTPADAAATTESITNAQAKELAWVKKMAEENAAFKRAETERVEATSQAERDAQEKALADAGKWDEAKALHSAELAKLTAGHAKQLLDLELKTELLGAGFKNPNWLKGSVAGYNAETHGTPAEYAAAAAKDEANAAFLATPGRTVHPGPTPAVVTGSSQTMTGAQIRLLESSTDPKDKKKARVALKAYRLEHGSYPD